MNPWNLIGLVAWLIVLVYLFFVIMNIRNRHLKMVVTGQQNKIGRTRLIDAIEIVILVVAAYGMSWVTWLRPVNYSDGATVSGTYSYARLVLQTDKARSYYVTTTAGNGKQPVEYYNYWLAGAKYSITSRNAAVSSGMDPVTVPASRYPWHTKKLRELDRSAEKAYVATYHATYQPTFMNGLGLRVGHTAQRFSIIRIPNDTFQKVNAVKEK